MKPKPHNVAVVSVAVAAIIASGCLVPKHNPGGVTNAPAPSAWPRQFPFHLVGLDPVSSTSLESDQYVFLTGRDPSGNAMVSRLGTVEGRFLNQSLQSPRGGFVAGATYATLGPRTFLLLNMQPDLRGPTWIDWVMLEGDKWAVEEAPPRWLDADSGGVGILDGRVTVAVSTPARVETWTLTDAGWTSDVVPDLQGGTRIAATGNDREFFVLGRSTEGDVVLLRRSANEAWHPTVLQKATLLPDGLFYIGARPGAPPILAWGFLDVITGGQSGRPEARRSIVATMQGADWHVSYVGDLDQMPVAVAATPAGDVLLTGGPTFWLRNGTAWIRCETSTHHRDPAAVIANQSRVLLASVAAPNLLLEAVDGRSGACLPSG